ncbi:unnamed protein product [Bursaphelenchus xylophilus]|uniref:(pine wood nematode) hypothetical protein n=1 Tax=Bursaphelenchus xylophilus TaxID=6326 RepID=A0A1I7RW47_BURXY|nr:unnamed protein product [Bursaphelenchus xylophilus]CAG9095117.1 unnamed protein product [Bursaphelenchus xylophilus]
MNRYLLILLLASDVRADWFLGCEDFDLSTYKRPVHINGHLILLLHSNDDDFETIFSDALLTEIACKALQADTNQTVGRRISAVDLNGIWSFETNHEKPVFTPFNDEDGRFDLYLGADVTENCRKVVELERRLSGAIDLTDRLLKHVIYTQKPEENCRLDELITEIRGVYRPPFTTHPEFAVVLHRMRQEREGHVDDDSHETVGKCPEGTMLSTCIAVDLVPGVSMVLRTSNSSHAVNEFLSELNKLNAEVEYIIDYAENNLQRVLPISMHRNSDLTASLAVTVVKEVFCIFSGIVFLASACLLALSVPLALSMNLNESMVLDINTRRFHETANQGNRNAIAQQGGNQQNNGEERPENGQNQQPVANAENPVGNVNAE